jgi:hypothetical protein
MNAEPTAPPCASSTEPFVRQVPDSPAKVEPHASVLEAEFTPGPECRPFDRHSFHMRLGRPSDGLRARWSGRRWVYDPAGREVLVRVVLMATVSGAFYLALARLESGAFPIILRLDVVVPERPAFTVGPADLLGTGDGVCLTVEPVA